MFVTGKRKRIRRRSLGLEILDHVCGVAVGKAAREKRRARASVAISAGDLLVATASRHGATAVQQVSAFFCLSGLELAWYGVVIGHWERLSMHLSLIYI